MPQPTHRRNTRQRKMKDDTESDSSDFDNQPNRGKISNEPSPAHTSQRRHRVPSLAEDVQRIENEAPANEKFLLHRLNLLRLIMDTLPDRPDRTETHRETAWKVAGNLAVFMILFMSSFILGHYIGYLGSEVKLINNESLRSLAFRINEESWKKDASLCKNTVKELNGILWIVSWIQPKYIKSIAIEYTNDDKQISGIFVHYAAVSVIIRNTPLENRGEEFYKEISDNIFLARQSLHSIKNLLTNLEVSLCAKSLWLAITEKVITEYVKQYDEEVFRQSWYKLRLALTSAEMRIWSDVRDKSFEAILMLDKVFGQDKKKYEVYGWALYIYSGAEFVLSRKISVPDTAASTTLLSDLFGPVQDRINNDNFPKLLLLLFPYRYA